MSNFFQNKKIFITGVDGFVGSNLAKYLLGLGSKIFGLAKNNKKESFEEYPLQPSHKCYPEYKALQNCLKPEKSTTPLIQEESKKYGIDEMINEQDNKLKIALKSLNSKQDFFNSNSKELRDLMNSRNWLSSELKDQLNSAIETKKQIMTSLELKITDITANLSTIQKSWNQSTFDKIVTEIQILENEINSLNIQIYKY